MISSKRWRAVGLLALWASVSLAGGCVAPQQTSTLEQSMGMLHERVNKLERRVDVAPSEPQNSSNADLYARMQEIQVKIGALNGQIEELDHKVQKIDQLAHSLAEQAAEQTTTAPQPPQPVVTIPGAPNVTTPPPPAQPHSPPPVQPPVSKPAPSAAQTPTQTPPPAPAPVPAQTPAASPQKQPAAVAKAPAKETPPQPLEPAATEKTDPEKAAYDKATQLFQQKQYASARKEYQNFSTRYPKSELADNALFSAGECYLAEQKYQEAIEAFQQVVDRYPGGNRVPNALLKQGAAFEKLGDSTAARILYQRIAEKYPGTPQGQIAEKKIK